MLKITNSSTGTEQRWTLCGQLTGPWVGELRSTWERTRSACDGQKCVIDLREVTFIDESGEALLQQMREDGAEFVASGVDTKDVLENLSTREERPLRRFLAHLENGCDRRRRGGREGE